MNTKTVCSDIVGKRNSFFQGVLVMRKVSAFLLLAMSLCAVAAAGAEAGGRLDRILAEKVLRVGTPGDYRPFSMLIDRSYEGHDIDVTKLIAKELGVRVEYVPTSWPTLMADHLAGKFDMSHGGITRNVARFVKADFLPPYAPFGDVMAKSQVILRGNS